MKKTKQSMRRRRIIFYVCVFAICLCVGYAIGEVTGEKVNNVSSEEITETEQAEEILASRYCLQLSEQDIRDIAAMVYLEARGECFEGQQAVAERMEVRNTTVSNWEIGLRCPKASRLIKLAKILGVTVEELLGE